MQATSDRKERGRISIDRLLGLLCAVLLLTLVGACRDQGSAATAGGTMDETVEIASETSEGEQFNGEVDEVAEQTDEATGEIAFASQEAGGEKDPMKVEERH